MSRNEEFEPIKCYACGQLTDPKRRVVRLERMTEEDRRQWEKLKQQQRKPITGNISNIPFIPFEIPVVVPFLGVTAIFITPVLLIVFGGIFTIEWWRSLLAVHGLNPSLGELLAAFSVLGPTVLWIISVFWIPGYVLKSVETKKWEILKRYGVEEGEEYAIKD